MASLFKRIAPLLIAFGITSAANAAHTGDSYNISFFDTTDHYLFGGSFVLGTADSTSRFRLASMDINGASSVGSPVRWSLPGFIDETESNPLYADSLTGMAGTMNWSILFTYNLKPGYDGGWDKWVYAPFSFSTGYYKLSPVVSVPEPSTVLMMGLGVLLVTASASRRLRTNRQ